MKKLFKAFIAVFAIATAFANVSSGIFAAITYTKSRSTGKLTSITDLNDQRQK